MTMHLYKYSISFLIFSSSNQTSTTFMFSKNLILLHARPLWSLLPNIIQVRLRTTNLHKFAIVMISLGSIQLSLCICFVMQLGLNTMDATNIYTTFVFNMSTYNTMSKSCHVNSLFLDYKTSHQILN